MFGSSWCSADSAAHALSAVRAGLGAAQLISPTLVARCARLRPLDAHEAAVARVLGARHVGQALITVRYPGRRALVLGAGVDLLHAASMAGLAAADRRRRRICSTSAVLAASFAAVGLFASGMLPDNSSDHEEVRTQ